MSSMSKKILFVVPSFRNGGTMSSLKNLLPFISDKGADLHVFAITNLGPNRDYISKYATVLGRSIDKDSINQQNRATLRDVLHRVVFNFVKWMKKRLCDIGIDITEMAFKSSVKQLEKNGYDMVVAFQEGQPTRYVSLFKNIKKIAWVRCDYSNMLRISGGQPQHELYSNIDQIVCVSEYTKKIFTDLLPETHAKTVAIYNLINTQRIVNGAEEKDNLDKRFDYDGFRIVSLGRIDPVKRFAMIPQIAKQLVDKGCAFKWYILGGKASDEEYELLSNNILRYNVSDNVVLLGEKNNPYPYIKQANLLVCTSVSEACPNVINEAKILHTPVVSTNFGSAGEFITNGIEGFVEPLDSIKDRIEMLIHNQSLYYKVKHGLSGFEYNNEGIIQMIINLILLQ